MKFFIDSADLDAIAELADIGLVDGVTTNPSIIAKSGRDFKEVIAEICKLNPGHVARSLLYLSGFPRSRASTRLDAAVAINSSTKHRALRGPCRARRK